MMRIPLLIVGENGVGKHVYARLIHCLSLPRLISSRVRTLENDVASERFSRTLYFQVNGVCLRLPPLRERRDDIPILREYFLGKYFKVAKKSSVYRSAGARFASVLQLAGQNSRTRKLDFENCNRKRTAQKLPISYKALVYKIKQIGLLNGDHEG
jgi:DNA-binding NtrC family response regulator